METKKIASFKKMRSVFNCACFDAERYHHPHGGKSCW